MLWNWIKKLFQKIRPKGPREPHAWPTLEQISLFLPFEEVTAANIVVITTKDGAQRAYDELAHADVVGFDTESKPTFVKGEKSTGPHVAQFATLERTYIFMLHEPACRNATADLIQLESLKKVGFGLSDDLKRIHIKLKVQPRSVVDIETLFTAKGYKKGVGVKIGVAIALKRQFKKSKKASTSNWGNASLTDKQIIYAANDAYAAIRVYDAFFKG